MMTKTEEARLLKTEKQWKYNTSENQEWNFQKWWRWTNDEKKVWKETLYDEQKARLVWEEAIFPKLDIEGTGADYE